MRYLHLLDAWRLTDPQVVRYFGSSGDHTCGAFEMRSPIDGGTLRILASSDAGWEHVSVSRTNRPPNWPEMEFIKRTFFRDEECVMQLHVPIVEHISFHPNCLHLWRPTEEKIPRPPAWMVGPPGMVPLP